MNDPVTNDRISVVEDAINALASQYAASSNVTRDLVDLAERIRAHNLSVYDVLASYVYNVYGIDVRKRQHGSNGTE